MRATTTPALTLTLILLATGLTGCLGADDADPDPTDDANGTVPGAVPGSTTLAWGLQDCSLVVAAIPVDAAAVTPHLPEGFTPSTPEAFGLPPHPTADAVMGVEAFQCASGAGLDGTVDNLAYGSYFAPVEPPAELADPNALFHFVKWDTLVPDADRRALLVEHGVPARDGGTDFTGYVNAEVGHAFQVGLDIGGESHTFHGVAPAPADPSMEDFLFLEFTPTENGLVVWRTQFRANTGFQGGGALELAPGSLAADIVGAEQTPSFYIAGFGSFEDASIVLPPMDG